MGLIFLTLLLTYQIQTLAFALLILIVPINNIPIKTGVFNKLFQCIFSETLNEDFILGTKVVFYLRDVRNGQGNKDIARKCKYISHFLSLLFASNREKPRVPLKSFNSSFLT